jgi:ribosomal protein S18 acetylase RimI-like enzyme
VSGELIHPATTPAHLRQVHQLLEAYAASIGVSLCFQDFDRELATLPGNYAPPRGGLWLAMIDDVPCGCIGLRPLAGAAGGIRPAGEGDASDAVDAQSAAGASGASNVSDAIDAVDAVDAVDENAAAQAADVAELKRLYVTPAARGLGVGRRLAQAAIDHARAAGYRTVKLDTLASMHAARALYASLGFAPCAAYYANPLDGVAYMALRL